MNLTEKVQQLRAELGRTFPAVDAVFDELAASALSKLTEKGAHAWLKGGKLIGSLGRGAEPMLVFLEEAPEVAHIIGLEGIDRIKDMAYQISRTPNSDAIVPFLQTAACAARRLEDLEQFDHYLDLVSRLMHETTPSVHGIVAMHPSPCLTDFLRSVPSLLQHLSVGGLKNWVDYGIKGYPNDPQGQSDYFALQSVEAQNILQRERHGTLLVDHERLLDLYLKGLWDTETTFHPYSLLFHEIRKPKPYLDKRGIHLPDVYSDLETGDGRVLAGIDRYRALLAHLVAHQRWTSPIIGDNFSPFQRAAAEVFEDIRVDLLAIREWPGLRRLFLAIHPHPTENAVPKDHCGVFHRLSQFSRAMLDPAHGYTDPILLEFISRFHELLDQDADTAEFSRLAIQWVVRSRQDSDRSVHLYLEEVDVDYRDDNRHMWQFIEPEEDELSADTREPEPEEIDDASLPPCHYDEWDYKNQLYRPDWVCLYERLHPGDSAAKIDALLEKHTPLIKRLQNLIDLLKPQNKVRVRFQEEGTELDLDIAIRSLIDYRAGAQPDPRINMSHRTDGRSIAVSLLLDLSVSINEKPPGSQQTILDLSQEAVSLLGWAVQQTGDPLAIGGFHSNSRHEVRYYHLKGYSEPWGDPVKSRLAAMQGNMSTRMGAALRHAGRGLSSQTAEKKLMLILTDGRPHDIDVKDEAYLIHDARMAVQELDTAGIYPYCISLDPDADDYVSDIFGKQYIVIDRAERLPEKLPELFIKLTQ
ncbi:MAG: VWA domain-containing protein [Gammaproteobacteria bacterium]|nr:MAG: VWA domain-containing protein [Gammaproteobacteria bacterium]